MNYFKTYDDFIVEKKTDKQIEILRSKCKLFWEKMEKKYNGLRLHIHYCKYAEGIILDAIVVEDKKKGTGTQVMLELCEFASKLNLPIYLTPDDSLGGNVNILHRFYKRFGFKKYSGYKTNQTMIKEPEYGTN